MFLKVFCVLAALWVLADAECTGTTQATCAAGCKWRSRVSECVESAIDQYIWVLAGKTRYGQVQPKSTWTFPRDSNDLEAFHGPEIYLVSREKLPRAPSSTVAGNPTIGQLIPWYANTVHTRDQPPLVQANGTFAYHHELAVGSSVTNYPKYDSFEFYYKDASSTKYWGEVHITIMHPDQEVDPNKYKCEDSDGWSNNGDVAGDTLGSDNWCYRGAATSERRPWVTQHNLPRVWTEVTSALDADPLSHGTLVDALEVRWVNNMLNVTAEGRLGYMGQRVFGFQEFQYLQPAVYPTTTWSLSDKEKMPQTMSFDKDCVSAAAGASASSWGKTFKALPKTNELTIPITEASQCASWSHTAYLCENAPLLTVQQGKIYDHDDAPKYDQPWSTALAGCRIFTTGIFPWEVILNYCFDGKYGDCSTHGSSNVFSITRQSNGDFLITFNFYNTAIQPNSHKDTVEQKKRGWEEIHHKFEVSINLAGKLDFSFETGVDIFTVDIQWFRYQSLSYSLSPQNNLLKTTYDRGLGINLIVYPDGYDAAYLKATARQVDAFQVFHKEAPKKVTAVTWYSHPGATGRPVGKPDDYEDDSVSWDNENLHFVVNPCTTEATTVNKPAESCDFQNITARLKMANDGTDNFAWNKRLVFQFTLLNGEQPNFIMDPNYKQTALSVQGAFSGKTATCRTWPELFEFDVKATRDPNIPHEGVNTAKPTDCELITSKAVCGPSAREGSGKVFPDSGATGIGCIWDYYREACLPSYSVTCQEPQTTTYGPTDRAMVMLDVTDVDTACTSIYSVLFEWTSGSLNKKVYAVYPGKTAPAGYDYLFPKYEFLHFQPLSKLERNMYPVPQTNLWDYGFVFKPGTINDNTVLRITAKVRITTSCSNIDRKNRRFHTQAESDSSMDFNAEFKTTKTVMQHFVDRVGTAAKTSGDITENVHANLISSEGTRRIAVNTVSNTPLYVTLVVVGAAIVGALIMAVLYVRKIERNLELRRVPSVADSETKT